MKLVAYHADPQIKLDILRTLKAHRAADEIVKGIYWENGKGCAVGRTINSSNHAEYETRFGIPRELALLEDEIFDGLPNDQAVDWPIKFMGAIEPGADLSLVVPQFRHLLLTDASVNPGIDHPLVRDAVAECAAIVKSHALGLPIDTSAAWRAVWSAAWSAVRSAEGAESAARSAWGRMAIKLLGLLAAAPVTTSPQEVFQ